MIPDILQTQLHHHHHHTNQKAVNEESDVSSMIYSGIQLNRFESKCADICKLPHGFVRSKKGDVPNKERLVKMSRRPTFSRLQQIKTSSILRQRDEVIHCYTLRDKYRTTDLAPLVRRIFQWQRRGLHERLSLQPMETMNAFFSASVLVKRSATIENRGLYQISFELVS